MHDAVGHSGHIVIDALPQLGIDLLVTLAYHHQRRIGSWDGYIVFCLNQRLNKCSGVERYGLKFQNLGVVLNNKKGNGTALQLSISSVNPYRSFFFKRSSTKLLSLEREPF